jgi:hypothetical protein
MEIFAKREFNDKISHIWYLVFTESNMGFPSLKRTTFMFYSSDFSLIPAISTPLFYRISELVIMHQRKI